MNELLMMVMTMMMALPLGHFVLLTMLKRHDPKFSFQPIPVFLHYTNLMLAYGNRKITKLLATANLNQQNVEKQFFFFYK